MSVASGAVDDSPSAIAYRELVYADAARVAGFSYLMVGTAAEAETIALDAFRRLWDAFRRGDVLGDAREQLYRNAARGALQSLHRAGNERGYQVPTTAPDKAVIAGGVVSGFPAQQRAAVLLVCWGGQDYRLAGVASGVGEARARDLVFAARQEYRSARATPAASTPRCTEIVPLLSVNLDEELSAEDHQRMEEHLAECATCRETAALFAELDQTLSGLRIAVDEDSVRDKALDIPTEPRKSRFDRLGPFKFLVSSPFVIAMSIIVVAVAFRDCGDPTIKTGAGRTSDVAIARANASLVVLDTGTGREIGRVPVGVLTPNGERVYSTRAGCRGNPEATTLSRSEIATLKTEELGCITGWVSAAAVDEAVNAVYVSDTAGQRLTSVDLQSLAVRSSVEAPPDQPALFDPRWLVEDGASILAVGQVADGAPSQSVVVRRVALPSLELSAGARFPAEDLTTIRLVPTSDGRVLAYDASTGRLRELDVARGQLLSATDLPGHQGVAATHASVAAHPIVLSTDERTLFAAVPEGGIVVLDIPSSQVIRRMNLEHHYLSIALGSGDGMIYAVESGNVYVVLDAGTGKELIRRPNLPLSDILEVSRGQ